MQQMSCFNNVFDYFSPNHFNCYAQATPCPGRKHCICSYAELLSSELHLRDYSINVSDFYHDIDTGIWCHCSRISYITQLRFRDIITIAILFLYLSRPEGSHNKRRAIRLPPSHHSPGRHRIPSNVRHPGNAAVVADNKKFHRRIWALIDHNWAVDQAHGFDTLIANTLSRECFIAVVNPHHYLFSVFHMHQPFPIRDDSLIRQPRDTFMVLWTV